jgi:hypothetical protein
MSKRPNELEVARKAKNSAAPHAVDVQTIFGAPILLEGEDPAQYEALAGHFRASIKPRDFLEAMWVHEIISYTWESVRYRRAKTSLLRSSEYRGLQEVLTPLLTYGDANELARKWARRDVESVRSVNETLQKAGRSQEDVNAQTLAVMLEKIERLDALQANVETRRNTTLREIERHRDILASRLRDASDRAIKDAEFTELNNQNAA